MSRALWQRLKDDPAALRALNAHLPPVGTMSPETPVANPSRQAAPTTGSWQNLANAPPGGPYNFSNPLVLTDGSVVVHVTDGAAWWKLTPDNTGSYVNGTWSQIASLPMIQGVQYAPKFFGSAVLPDGRVSIEGGQYNDGNAVWSDLGAIYDPVGNTWTAVNPPSGWTQIGNAQTAVLANGTLMLADCCDAGPNAALLTASSLTWTATGTGKFDSYDSEAWALLPSGKVLTADAYVGTGSCGTGTEIYNPATGAWTSAGNVPTQLADCNTANGNQGSYAIGPAVLTYNNSALAFGGTTSTTAASALAVYSLAANTWSAGANLPQSCGSGGTQSCTMANAPAAVLPSGNVLIATSAGLFQTPANFFEYSPTANSYAAAALPADAASASSFYYNFLVLPSGQVLSVSTYTSNIQIYTPSGSYQASWQPVVSRVPSCVAPNGTYVVSGSQLNGLTQGGYYGNDVQAATNYPLVRIKNSATGHVFYAWTFNFSTMGLAANAAGSASFKVAAATESGASTLYVVANGIPSAGTAVTVSASCGNLRTATHDLNGDGRSDILWRNTSGSTALWLMNGGQVSQSGGFGTVPTTWGIVGQRDFNGDGNADILWRDNSGNTSIWMMNGLAVTSTSGLGNVPTNWTIYGTGDLNGDGQGDILWRDSAGDIAIWFINGGTVSSTASLGNLATSWTIVGDDNKGDIFLHDNAGDYVVWELNGAQVVASASLGNIPLATWSIVGFGDFNGDGNTDILWRDTAGDAAIWFLNSSRAVQSTAGLGNIPTNWSVAQTGDYNGDGQSDIVWIDTAGDIALWFINGGTVSSTAGLGNVGTTWTVQSVNAE